jgi:outer membrane protein
MKKFALSLAALALAVPAFAQTTAPARVAVFNVQKVLAESNAGKSAYDRLKKAQDDKAARAQKMDEELKALDQQLSAKKMSLSDEKLADLQKQFSEKKIALQRYAQDADRELTELRDKSLQDLERQLVPVIQEIGKEMGFAAIFNRFDSGIVYASDAIDITDVVTKRFNDSAAKGTAPAAAKK